jgi:hypothetical protein
VIHDGEIVGRIYRIPRSERWRWTQSGPWAPSHPPNGGVAGSLEEAEVAFRAAREAQGESPLPEKADERRSISGRLLMTRMYGPAVRGKRFRRSWAMRSCINVSGL